MVGVKTGISGFDKLVGGGFERGATIVLCGTPGTAKTIFSTEFIYNGAAKFGEKGLYVTFEETRPQVFAQAEQFGWDLQRYEKKGLLQIVCVPAEEINYETVERIISIIKKEKIQRLPMPVEEENKSKKCRIQRTDR